MTLDEAMGMTASDIFADAFQTQEAALERLEQNDIRDAAEKAWCATKRATDTLILAHSAEEPEQSTGHILRTTQGLRHLAHGDAKFRNLQGRYHTRVEILHGMCFYFGVCEPIEDTERLIMETRPYIEDAQVLAGRG